jgi:hypothetical protein
MKSKMMALKVFLRMSCIHHIILTCEDSPSYPQANDKPYDLRCLLTQPMSALSSSGTSEYHANRSAVWPLVTYLFKPASTISSSLQSSVKLDHIQILTNYNTWCRWIAAIRVYKTTLTSRMLAPLRPLRRGSTRLVNSAGHFFGTVYCVTVSIPEDEL